jgi:hypothetical protein
MVTQRQLVRIRLNVLKLYGLLGKMYEEEEGSGRRDWIAAVGRCVHESADWLSSKESLKNKWRLEDKDRVEAGSVAVVTARRSVTRSHRSTTQPDHQSDARSLPPYQHLAKAFHLLADGGGAQTPPRPLPPPLHSIYYAYHLCRLQSSLSLITRL